MSWEELEDKYDKLQATVAALTAERDAAVADAAALRKLEAGVKDLCDYHRCEVFIRHLPPDNPEFYALWQLAIKVQDLRPLLAESEVSE